ncbi:MAG: hydantoinase/oxoprolinase family protein [Hyphomicrobiaceae bacterium]
MLRVAFDIGGTFTDFVMQDDSSGRVRTWKVLSTPSDPSEGALGGLQQLLDAERVSAADITHLLHATTVAANAVIERKGSRVALVTTEGFRDIIVMGRQKRYDTYDLYLDMPRPLVSRRDVFEVSERMDARGEVVDRLREDSVRAIIPSLRAGGFAAIAVCLIHSYANPRHEQRVRELLAQALPGATITISAEISPKIREYERTSTTVTNAYVQPIVKTYLEQIQRVLKARDVRGALSIMQSSGGLVTPELAARYPVRIVESGPAAGVLMCADIARQEGIGNVLTFDMGGTTAKLGAVDDGEPAVTSTFEIARERFREGSGLPLNVPAVELLEIGAGGGSIATTEMGMIRVGPESAGADPGPVCYGLGGRRATVTDANLVLGLLNPDYFNGGTMKLDRGAAEAAIREQIAEPLGLTAGEAAWGIHRIANSNMERAMRVVSVERGRNPADYALVAFGGAGPLHGARLARELGVPTLIVPARAGVGSAVGLLAARSKIDVALTRLVEIDKSSSPTIAAIYEELAALARPDVQRLGLSDSDVVWVRYAYMRYRGQGHERKIDLPPGPIDDAYAGTVIASFNDAYRKNYGYLDPGAVVEAVDWYLVASASVKPGSVPAEDPKGATAAGSRQAYFPEVGGYTDCRVVSRYGLAHGDRITGPAVIEERESTTVVLPGDVATVSANGSIVVSIKQEA